MVEDLLLPGMAAILGTILVVSAIVGLALYVYTAWALMTIGKKLKVEPTWLAWIPIVNFFYIPRLAGYEWYYGFLWLLGLIPIVGWLVSPALLIWWFWRISEARNRDGWMGILMIIPIANLVVLGILAWGK